MMKRAELPPGFRAWACFAVFDQGGPDGETLLPLAVVFADEAPSRETLEETISQELPDGRWTYEVEPVSALGRCEMLKFS